MDIKFDINNFKTDKTAETAGVWVEFGGGASFKLASFDSPAFTEAFRKATKPYHDLGRKVPTEDQEVIMAKCMAQHIVLDWKGVFEGDNVLEYSIEAAERLLNELDWIRNKIVEQARSLENFRAKAKEATEGN